MNDKGVAYLDFYILTGDEQASLEASGLNSDKHAMVVTTASYTANDIATTFSTQVRLIMSNTGKTPKKIGYASYLQPNGLILTFGILEF